MLGTIWVCAGFALGTLILLGPLRLWVNYVRANSIPSGIESAVVVFMIILLVYFSFSLSIKLFQWQLLSDHVWAGKVTVLVPLFFASVSVWLFMHPAIMNNEEASENVAAKFSVGPYPTEERMRELKAQGYTTIVSLLHPAVVPFKPS